MKRILLIEDHPDTQVWLRDILNEVFPTQPVEVVASVADGKAKANRHIYELAIIDLNLPDGNGVEIILHLKSISQETLAVVATAFDDDGNVLRALRAGADGYVLKDQPRAALKRTLSRLQNGEPPLSPRIARQVLSHFAQSTSSQEPAHKTEQLTEREKQTLSLIARGVTNQEVARELEISAHTVASHIKSIYRKLGISTRAEASLQALHLGLLRE